MKHLLTLKDISTEEINDLFKLTKKLKYENKIGRKHHLLKGKTLGMIFSKSSTRTRVSFETGMYQLGGHPLFLSSNDIQLGRGESIYDTAKVLSRYIDGIMIRTFEQSDVEDLAKYGDIPVINALTDLYHPCQILADLFTIQENFGKLEGLKLAYIGDGNNIAHSLLYGCVKTNMDIAIGTPDKYTCDSNVINDINSISKDYKGNVTFTNNPIEAIKDADVVYTDTWISMGMEAEKEQRIKDFDGFQVNESLFSHAKDNAIFLHCLPAYRGYEVSSEIIDGEHSKIFDEAENRLHIQKAVLVKLMGEK